MGGIDGKKLSAFEQRQIDRQRYGDNWRQQVAYDEIAENIMNDPAWQEAQLQDSRTAAGALGVLAAGATGQLSPQALHSAYDKGTKLWDVAAYLARQ